MIERVIVPDLGATGDDVRIAEWLVKEGDFVSAGAPLFVLETDKATQAIEAFRSGYLRQILVPADATVGLGDAVAILADSVDEPFDGMDALPSHRGADAGLTTAKGRPPATAPPHREPARSVAAVPATAAQLGERTSEGEQDIDSPSQDQLLVLFRRMVLIRRYEDHLYRLFLQGIVPGTLHQCQGQEAVAVGVCAALRTDDVIFSTHRPVGHLLAKGASIRAITAEIWGKVTGCAGGKGGQMHLLDLAVSAMPSNAIVGANIPIATGAALGFQLRGLDRVAVSFFGDGAANIGTFHEGINLAAVKNAPVVFVCENNLYAASTPIALTTKVANIADRAGSYGIPGHVVDGMDVLAVLRSAAAAVARARAGGGPTLLEYKTYRYPGHSRGDPGNYRSKDEYQAWRRRDPIQHCREMLVREFGLSDAQLEAIEGDCQAEVEEAVQLAIESPEPRVEAALEHVYAEREVGP
jgi:TPP-dependent pyruvate/acetoin dehydrogenase alpha subunit